MGKNYCRARLSFKMFFQLIIALVIAGSASAQSGDTTKNIASKLSRDSVMTLSSSQMNQIGEIAKTLIGNKANYLTFPAEIKKSITKSFNIDIDAKQYALPTGESRVLLIQLPEYDKPYNLIIRSLPHGPISAKIKLFSPRGLFFDSSFNAKQELLDTSFKFHDKSWKYPVRLETDLLIEENLKDNRYLFIYNLNKNEKLGYYIDHRSGLIGLLINHPIITTPDGRLVIEVKYIK